MTEAEQILPSKSMDWFLYDNGLRHERVKWFRFINNLSDWLFFEKVAIDATLIPKGLSDFWIDSVSMFSDFIKVISQVCLYMAKV